jgi:adenosylmethionine-8-amino-7-oxononanoate aminotransferase
MSVHARLREGKPEKNQFFYLENAYHGETIGAMSVSDLGLYKHAYQSLLFRSHILTGVPYVDSKHDALYLNADSVWKKIENQLEEKKLVLTAVIVEPILQAAAGMYLYSAAFLKKLSEWCKENDVHLIADEIMTGMGRTGRALACDHAGITPDFLCLGKGLTAGYLPLSVVLTTDDIYQLFYDELYSNAFLHSHTFSGNALAARAALAVMKYMEKNNVYGKAEALEDKLWRAMKEVEAETGLVHRVRALGAMAACELLPPHDSRKDAYAVFRHALHHGAFLRPLPPVIYWTPPLTIEDHTIEELKVITIQSILSLKH